MCFLPVIAPIKFCRLHIMSFSGWRGGGGEGVGVLGVEVGDGGGWRVGGGGVACNDREDDGAIKMCVK